MGIAIANRKNRCDFGALSPWECCQTRNSLNQRKDQLDLPRASRMDVRPSLKAGGPKPGIAMSRVRTSFARRPNWARTQGYCKRGSGGRRQPSQLVDAAFLLTIGSFLLTVELLCLQLCCGACLLTIGAFLVTMWLFYFFPDPPILAFSFDLRVFFFCFSLLFGGRFSFLFQGLQGFSEEKKPLLSSGFPCFFSEKKKQGWRVRAVEVVFTYSWKVPLISTWMDCKQRSSTVSKKAPTVSKKASPVAIHVKTSKRLPWTLCPPSHLLYAKLTDWVVSLPATYRSLEAFRAENCEKVSKKIFPDLPARSLKKVRKRSRSAILGTFRLFWDFLRLQVGRSGKI